MSTNNKANGLGLSAPGRFAPGDAYAGPMNEKEERM